ncbi:MAG: YbaB/EbfC family nucleoid-associated protein [Armatimonadetes bacterium]|nr:YbaB/EbfC family nucleoid-associated protein [Armatimonadota bacterium]MBS1712541.1 YbaB/EbfC family nucleoid-associated protein [Armatimonadota bacterium]MBX3109150.1 YbaB/EbfC family nucleoid-associated protein [Fimbriimonadaceae bacterium]
MKLPKNFGGQSMSGMMAQAQQAMERAKNLDAELANERFDIDKNGVKCTFNGLGELQALKIDPKMVDPDDLEMLEDMIVAAIKDGFAKATETRDSKVQEIMPNVPGLDKLGL